MGRFQLSGIGSWQFETTELVVVHSMVSNGKRNALLNKSGIIFWVFKIMCPFAKCDSSFLEIGTSLKSREGAERERERKKERT